MDKKTHVFNLLIIVTLFLSACNLPSSNTNDIAGTAAAQTVQALLSATPLPGATTSTSTPGLPVPATQTPTPHPISTNTPVATPTTYCSIMQFVADITYPDGTVVSPGAAFTKTWRLKNVGTCTWTPSYAVVFSDGNSMNGPSTQALVGNVNPGQTIDISVNLTAPASAGDYKGNWKIRDASGVLFGNFYIQIKVQGPATATFTALPLTATYTSVPAFAVTSVTYILGTWNDAGHTNCPRITANITTNGAGTVNYEWKSSSGTNPPQTLTFASASTQTINYDWARGSALNGTPASVGIYIGSPNNQDFGKQNFTTACTTP